jgi:hypothetical protein
VPNADGLTALQVALAAGTIATFPLGQTRALKVVGVAVDMRAGNEQAAAILVSSGARFDWSVARGHRTGGCTRGRRLRSKPASTLQSAFGHSLAGGHPCAP